MLAATYFQLKILNLGSSRITKPNLVNNSISQQIPAISSAKKRLPQIYYIDHTKGDNRDSGTSMVEAWKDFSILKKVSFIQGDKILLKRGEVWNQRLFPPVGGTEKKPIIIDAYGSGRLPVIDVQKKYPVAIKMYHSYISINNIRVQNSAKTSIGISVPGGLKNIKLNKLKIFNAGKNGIGVYNGGTKLEITKCYIENSGNNGIHLGGSPDNKLSYSK